MRLFGLVLLFCAVLFAKEVKIESEDGFVMYGWLETPSKKAKSYPLALFAHQFGADHTIWNDLAKELQKKGYATLLVDLRGHGKSIMQKGAKNEVINDVSLDHIAEAFEKSNKKVGFGNIPKDLALWLDYAAKDTALDMKKLVLFGSSLGGGAILPLMVSHEPVAIVSISPGGGDAEEIKTALNYSESASLFVAAKDDPLKAQDRALEYSKDALRGTFLMISGDGHGTVLLPRVQEYVMVFLAQNIK